MQLLLQNDTWELEGDVNNLLNLMYPKHILLKAVITTGQHIILAILSQMSQESWVVI
jgi:hypothetical protein